MTWSERVTSWFQPDHWLPKTLFVVVVIFVVLTIIGFVIEKQREKDARKAIQRTALVKKFKEKYGVLNNDTRFYYCNRVGFLMKAELYSNQISDRLVLDDDDAPTVCPNWEGKN